MFDSISLLPGQTKPELWQFEVSLVQSVTGSPPAPLSFVRFRSRAGPFVFFNSGEPCPHQDFDFEGSTTLENLEKARSLLKFFNFSFPIPLTAKAAAIILSLKNFPSYEAWDQMMQGSYIPLSDYTEKNYRHDLGIWWRNRLIPKNFHELTVFLKRSLYGVRSKPSLQDRAASARMALNSYEANRTRLKNYYQIVGNMEDEKLVNLLFELGQSHFSEPTRNVKKERKSASGGDTEKKSRKGKTKPENKILSEDNNQQEDLFA